MRIIGGIVLGLAAGLLVAGAVVRKKIERELSDTRLGEFRFTCERVRVNLLRQSLTLGGVRLKTAERDVPPDSLLDTPVQFLNASVGRITLRGVSLSAIRDKRLEFTSLTVDSPDMVVVTRQMPPDSLTAENETETALKRIGIGEIRLTNGTFDWRQITETDTLQYKIYGLNTQLSALRANSTEQSRRRFLFSDRMSGSVGTFRYTFANRAYILAADSLTWDSALNQIAVDHLELLPQFTKWEFPRKSVRQSDYMQLSVDGLGVTGIDFDALWNEKTLHADSVHIASGHFVSSKDRNADVPRRVKPMIHATIQQLGLPVSVRRVKVDDLNAAYEELGLHRTVAGRVTFDHIDATFHGFTNIVTRPEQYIELYAASQVMQQGQLHAVISMPVDPANDHFDIKATLLSSSIPALNPMILPLANIEVKSGVVDRMDYHMAGNDTSADIHMTLRYRDLKVELLKQQARGWRERSGLSNVVNWAFIRPENPDKNGLRNVQTTVRRDPYRSTWNYIWKGVSSSALETAETGAAKRLMGK